MIWYTLELFAIFVECYLVCRFLIQYFGFSSQKFIALKWLILFSAISMIDYCGTYWITSVFFQISMSVIACFVFAVLFLNGTHFEKIMISTVGYILFAVVNLPVLAMFAVLSGDSISELITAQDALRIQILLITKLVYFFLTQMILIFKKKKRYYFQKSEWLLVIITMLITITISFLLSDMMFGSKNSDLLYVILTALISALFIIIYILIERINVGNKQKVKNHLLTFQLDQEKNNMQNLYLQYEETRKIRHDMKNYIGCALELIKDKNYSLAEEYLKEFADQRIDSIKKYVNTSSGILNAVINSKLSLAESDNISVVCIITGEIKTNIEFDLSILLSNLLDNAIESCRKNTSPSEIALNISNTAGYLHIQVKNSIPKSVLKDNPNLKTSKTNKNAHGIGLKSVRDIVEQHSGMIDIYEKDQTFIVSIMLKND